MGKPAVLVAGTTIDDEDFVVSHGGNLLLIVLRSRWSASCSEAFL